MRKLLLLLPLVVAACSSDGNNGNDLEVQPLPVQQAPQVPILDLKPFIPVPAEGDGRDWTARLRELPFTLNDVIWDDHQFVAVGNSGVVLTSANGIDWAQRESGTDIQLNAVAFDGSDIVAVGYDAKVLLSPDQGESWSIKHSGDRIRLGAVTINPWQIVAGGMDLETGDAVMMRSVDRGENWAVVESLPQTGHFVTDLVYANGLYVAATDAFSWESDVRVLVSVDGEAWQHVILRGEAGGLHTILHDGRQFIAAGGHNAVFTSVDGYVWTGLQTPIDRVSYLSVASSGPELMLAGGITWWYWWGGTIPDFERDIGISSSDGGAAWTAFNIDGYYQSNSMAWGNGRFVSVGQPTPISEEGAIYTSP